MRELFLISFGGTQYGIRKDEILSVKDIHALHRIPLSPAHIAGIMFDEGRTVTLADLTVCIGFESTQVIEQGSILLMEKGEKVTGFVARGEILAQSIHNELIFPLPDYLKTPVFDTCAIHGGVSVPIINIAALYSRALKTGDESSRVPLSTPVALPREISGTEPIRFFDAGGELYAVSAACIDDKAVKPGPITPLPNTPQYVKGVTFREGRLMTVIDLTQRINRQSAAPESLMLVAEIADAAFGFLIDNDGGTLSAEEVTIKPAPMIAQSSLLKGVVASAGAVDGELIPLIDLAMLLSSGSGAAYDKPLWQRYVPGSGFPALFARHEVEVVEFSLLGVRHALPKAEVEDVIAYKRCWMLPDVLPIVIGVAEHKGEILPVVDLAMMFGRRSLATPAWRMMLVNNGDFRALVITEAVFGERRLPPDIHRTVPIHLPHNLMYGCYPDEKEVRIILNVEAIAVHFAKSLIQTFLPALTPEMRMVSTDAEPAHKVELAPALSPEEPEAPAVQEQASVHQEADQPVPELQQHAVEEAIESTEVREAITGASAVVSAAYPSPAEPEFIPLTDEQFVEWLDTDITALSVAPEPVLSDGPVLEQEPVPPAETVLEMAEVGESEAVSEESTSQEFMARQKKLVASLLQAVPEFGQQAAEDAEFVEWDEAETVASAIAQEPEPIEGVRAAALSASTLEPLSTADDWSTGTAFPQEPPPLDEALEKTIATETMSAAEESPEPTAQVNVAPVRELSGDGNDAREPVAMKQKSPFEVLAATAKNKQAQKISTTASADRQASEPILAAPGTMFDGPYRTGREVEQLTVLPNHEESTSGKAWKRRIAYGAIIAVLIAVFYFSGISDKPVVEKSAKKMEAKQEQDRVQTEQVIKKIEQPKAELEQPKVEAEQDKAQTGQSLVLTPLTGVQTESPRSAGKSSRNSLELAIPKNMPQVDIDEYVVVKGDTLWEISKRYTGNPYNYPRIAGENRIADPDHIFPGQKIRLVR